MKLKLLNLFITILFLVLAHCNFAYSQQLTGIKGKCPSPNVGTFSSVIAGQTGDIFYTPCGGRSSIFTGIVDFSGATITGAVTGTGTTNFVPLWTNGAGGVLGNSPISFSSGTYNFRNAALNNTFIMQFTPDNTNGLFTVGATGVQIVVDKAAGELQYSGVSNEVGITNYSVNKTNTATIGDVTINKPAGVVNMALGAHTLTITNSIARATSVILITGQELDSACQIFTVDAKTPGSFAITESKGVDCAADTAIGFLILN